MRLKYPDLEIHVQFWIDAIQYKDDWEFIWRTIWNKLIGDDKYEKMQKEFVSLIDRYKDDNKLSFLGGLILHPKHDAQLFLRKLNYISEYCNQWLDLWCSILVPTKWTKIYNLYKWYFVPDYFPNNWLDYRLHIQQEQISYWGHFFRNSYLLDIYVLCMMSKIINFSRFKLILQNWTIDWIEIELSPWKWIFKILNMIYEFNSLISFMNMIKRENLYYICEYIKFLILREEYICSINPSYDTKEVKEYISNMKLERDRFIGLCEFRKDG